MTTLDQENELIKANKAKPEAKKVHKFKAAEWTHPNGHPRCLTCGDEEPVSGMCNRMFKSDHFIENEEVPYLCGYSVDGKKFYMDKRFNPILKLKDGRKMDCRKYLLIHEETEKQHEDTTGQSYQHSHELATGKERKAVEKDGYPWDEYQKYCLVEAKRLTPLDDQVPKDIDLKPEEDYGDKKMINTVRKLQKKNPVKSASGKLAHLIREHRMLMHTLKYLDKPEIMIETVAQGNELKGYEDKANQLNKADEDYRIQHTAPTSDGGSPIHDLTNTFPEDLYSSKGAQYYGHNVPYDHKAIGTLRGAKGNPNAKVRIYRAVPHIKTNNDKIQELTNHKAYIQKTGKIPKDAWPRGVGEWNNKSDYYEFASNMIDSLKSKPEPAISPIKDINNGDWVTTTREYAKEHGEGVHGPGNYKIISKIVPAKHVWSDGNSIHEYGYDNSQDIPKKSKASNLGKNLDLGRLRDAKALNNMPETPLRYKAEDPPRELGPLAKGADEIARDHLTEDPNYYNKLATLEKARPTYEGEVDQKGNRAVKHRQANSLLVWEHAPDKQKNFQDLVNTHLKPFTQKLSPEHQSIINHVADRIQKDPTRHYVESTHPQTKLQVPKLRHLAALVSGNPSASLQPMENGSLLWRQERHGSVDPHTYWEISPHGIKDITGNMKTLKKLKKSLNPLFGNADNAKETSRERKGNKPLTTPKKFKRTQSKKTTTGKLLQKSDAIPVSTVAVINGDHILMGRRKDSGKLTFPGGHADIGEHPEQAAKRELFEEAGINAKDLHYLGQEEIVGRDGKARMINCFVTFGHYTPSSKNDPDQEIDEWYWVPMVSFRKEGIFDELDPELADQLHSQPNAILNLLGIKH